MLYTEHNNPLPVGYTNEAWKQYFKEEREHMTEQKTLDQLLQHKSPDRPRIVCLCGSTSKALQAFQDANLDLTLKGFIVLSIGCDKKSDVGLELSEYDLTRLDILHLHKIDLADVVYVLNVDGYIGESTKREIKYAERIGKPISYLEPLYMPYACVDCQKPLNFPHTFFYQGLTYCSTCLPEYSRESEEW